MTAALAAAVAALVAWAAVCTVRRMRRGGGCCGEHEAPVAKSAVKDRPTLLIFALVLTGMLLLDLSPVIFVLLAAAAGLLIRGLEAKKG